MVSALTMLALDEMMARYASYQDLAEIIRHRSAAPAETLREPFSRIVFNILCGNTRRSCARNHAAFWDGAKLSTSRLLTTSVRSVGRSGQEAGQAMLISGNNRMSRIASCLEAAYITSCSARRKLLRLLKASFDALGRIGRVSAASEAALSDTDRNLFWGRQFLNPYAFTALEGSADALRALADELRQQCQRLIHYGRTGEIHTERFSGTKP